MQQSTPATPPQGKAFLSWLDQLGYTEDINGNQVPHDQYFDALSGEAVYQTLKRSGSRIVLELGFAAGNSTLFLLQAVTDNGGGLVLSLDPSEMDVFKGVGIRNVQRAGLSQYHQFAEARSDMAMPQLLGNGHSFDCIFVDTNHQFDQTMVEGYYADKLLKVGGVLIYDDYHLSSVKTACNFMESNMQYCLDPIHSEPEFEACGKRIRILRKTQTDVRPWFHFIPFEVATEDQMTWRLAMEAEKKAAEKKETEKKI